MAIPPATPRAGDLGDVILAIDLPDGIEARAFRDGMIAFRLGTAAPSREVDYVEWMRIGVRLINAHLACLHTAMSTGPFTKCAVLGLADAMQVSLETGSFQGSTAN